jgi:hypothetical protein
VTFLFYISGHGLGHATRMAALMRALRSSRPNLRLTVRTMAPAWVFDDYVPGGVDRQEVVVDAGMVERDLLHQDIPATLERHAQLLRGAEPFIAAEAAVVRAQAPSVIVSDIPPLASRVGRAAGVPVIAVGNFTWDYILEPYVRSRPDYRWLLEAILAAYAETDLYLRLPLSHVASCFPRQRKIPLIARVSTVDRDTARRELGLQPAGRPVALLGGRLWDPAVLRGSDLVRDQDLILLSLVGPIPDARAEVHFPGPEWLCRFPDLLAASDVAIAKLGYGMAAECVAAGTALLHPPRYDFAEYGLIKREFPAHGRSREIPEEDWLSGRWVEHLRTLLGTEPPRGADVSGAEVAARHVLALADGETSRPP